MCFLVSGRDAPWALPAAQVLLGNWGFGRRFRREGWSCSWCDFVLLERRCSVRRDGRRCFGEGADDVCFRRALTVFGSACTCKGPVFPASPLRRPVCGKGEGNTPRQVRRSAFTRCPGLSAGSEAGTSRGKIVVLVPLVAALIIPVPSSVGAVVVHFAAALTVTKLSTKGQ